MNIYKKVRTSAETKCWVLFVRVSDDDVRVKEELRENGVSCGGFWIWEDEQGLCLEFEMQRRDAVHKISIVGVVVAKSELASHEFAKIAMQRRFLVHSRM